MLSLDICLSALFYFCILIFIIFMQCTNFYIMVILALCEAYPRPFQLPIYLTDKSLEDEKELSSYTKGSQSILYISVLIAAGSFAAAFLHLGATLQKARMLACQF
jgi:hypothetical protein